MSEFLRTLTTAETDAVLMTLVIFIPSIFALALAFFPKGYDEAMRWCTLCGTALTLGLSLCMFIYFTRGDPGHLSTNTDAAASSSLNDRVKEDFKRSSRSDPHLRDDFVARYSWIPAFNIEYYLGA